MPIRLRFALHGVRHNRIFHLVAIDQRARRDGKPAELLGIYNPRPEAGTKEKRIEWSVNRIKYWLSVGAIPSKSVVKLLETGGIIQPNSIYHPRATGKDSIVVPDETTGAAHSHSPERKLDDQHYNI